MRERRRNESMGRASGAAPVGAAIIALFSCADPITAQARAIDSTAVEDVVPDPADRAEGERHPFLLWTRASDANRILVGQWTWHLSKNRHGVQNDRILAVVYEGYFLGSFRTTHGPRAYTVGLERHWLSVGSKSFRGAVGYRLGLVYGYDGRLGWLAEAVPVLPFAQPLVYARAGPVSADLTHTWVVISVAAGVPF
jgi:hypothetical protein